MKTGMAILSFVGRHLLFVFITTLLACLVWTIAYIILLLIAMITNSGVGGPLAYPAMLLAIMIIIPLFGLGMFAPASGVGLIACRIFKLPKLAAIPFVLLTAFLIHWFIFSTPGDCQTITLKDILAHFAVYLTIPLGVYWWLIEGPIAVFDLFKRLWNRTVGGSKNQS